MNPPPELPSQLAGTPAEAPSGATATEAAATGSRMRARATRLDRARERIRVVLRGVGEILITLGLVLLLFCAYQLWWTDVTSSRATDAVLQELDTTFAVVPPTLIGKPIPPLAAPKPGDPFARMYVPRFGQSWVKPVIQGTALGDLHKGVGHYTKSAMPGEVGNFAVAGHRTTNGHPFRKIDKLVVGDKIFVETKDAWYVYKVTESRIVVSPTDTYVVAPVPVKDKADAKPTEKLITLTSCHPPYSASQRMIAHGVLVETRARGLGPPAGAPAGVN